MMEAEFKVPLDVVTGVNKPTQRVLRLKLIAASLFLTLCFVIIVVFLSRQQQGQGQDEDSFDLHHTLRQISDVRAAIHLKGEHNPDMKTSVEWKTQVDQSYSQGGLELDNNEIVVPRDGLYFIYSQASFRVNCATEDSSSSPLIHLSHIVKRWSNTYANDGARRSYETILHTVRTACQKTASSNPDQQGRWFSALYTGAVFSLSKGDRLQTVMEEEMLANLEEEPGKTFFGVFAL